MTSGDLSPAQEMVQKVLTNPNDSPHQIWKTLVKFCSAGAGERDLRLSKYAYIYTVYILWVSKTQLYGFEMV
jgi:hypothetical protein